MHDLVEEEYIELLYHFDLCLSLRINASSSRHSLRFSLHVFGMKG